MSDLPSEFARVRDILYRIPLAPGEPDHSCTGKTEELMAIFEEAGRPVRERICLFSWSSLGLPDEVLAVPHDDEGSHAYFEAEIAGVWRTIDATWDAGLEDILPVNYWNGETDTELAVPPTKILSVAEGTEFLAKANSPEAVSADLARNGQFYKAFNEYLAAVRSGAGTK